MVIINSNIYDLASEPQTVEPLQNVFILIYRRKKFKKYKLHL